MSAMSELDIEQQERAAGYSNDLLGELRIIQESDGIAKLLLANGHTLRGFVYVDPSGTTVRLYDQPRDSDECEYLAVRADRIDAVMWSDPTEGEVRKVDGERTYKIGRFGL